MVARGPDDEGLFRDQAHGLALGARRLSIIDVQGGHQPLANEDGTVWCVLNGEIYNYAPLRERLSRRGHVFQTKTDTEVLVHLYEDYGADLVHALDGMYAFAIWDSTQRRLILARDRFGEKPLFFSVGDGNLVFASELSALLVGAGLDGELDPEAVDAYFVLGYVPMPASVVRDVSQLRPGSLLLWEQGRAPIERRYWEPEKFDATGVPASEQELIAELERLLDESVRARLAADVPLGVFLSGGVDSTLVAAFAARHSVSPIKTFTIDYDVGSVGEGMAARTLANQLGADHHELLMRIQDVPALVLPLLAGLDQPLADQALVALHAVSQFARPEITVALSGEGADELFGGYPRYRWLERAFRLERHLPDSLAHATAASMAAVPTRRMERLATVLRPASLSDRHLAWTTFGRREARDAVYGPRLDGVSGTPLVELPSDFGDGNAAASLIALDLDHWLPDNVLAKADRASMRASLELRTPYLHREIAEFAATIPPVHHLKDGGKRLLRRLLGRMLPAVPRRLPKRAFQVPACAWLRGPLAPAMRRHIHHSALYDEGWFERGPILRAFENHTSGRTDATQLLWPILTLGLWLDRLRGDNVE
jgi:asparagine synthase (glutamine-hydrolysing)